MLSLLHKYRFTLLTIFLVRMLCVNVYDIAPAYTESCTHPFQASHSAADYQRATLEKNLRSRTKLQAVIEEDEQQAILRHHTLPLLIVPYSFAGLSEYKSIPTPRSYQLPSSYDIPDLYLRNCTFLI